MTNQYLRRLAAFLLLGAATLLTGCLASSKPYVSLDGRQVVTGSVRKLDGGREIIISDRCETALMTPQERELVLSGKKAPPPCIAPSEVEVGYGTSVERDVFVGAVPVVIGNKMQRDTAIKVEKLRQEGCEKEGGCGQDLTLINYNEGVKVSNKVGGSTLNSGLVNQVGVGVEVNTGCSTCALPAPAQPKPAYKK